ncbi:MAG: DUF1365 family protein [Candidatus Melainabacteria bacterium]|nr:MAG: DUF1365 family protein [Candidatus Melainabacteria bacterium]
MKSAIYEFSIEHHRLSPKRHSFKNKHYMFLFDLDELDELDRNLKLFSHHGRALFNFRNSDYSYAGDDSARSKLNRFLLNESAMCRLKKYYYSQVPDIWDTFSIRFLFTTALTRMKNSV